MEGAPSMVDPGGSARFLDPFFSCAVTPTTLALSLGVPYLVATYDLSTSAASVLLATLTSVAVLSGPPIGFLADLRPTRRVGLVMMLMTITLGFWALLLGSPGRPWLPLVVLAFVWFSLGAPLAMLGVVLARDSVHLTDAGTANGLIVSGGFVASGVAALSGGWLIDLGGGLLSPTANRLGLIVIPAVTVFGLWRLRVWSRRVIAA